MDWFNSLICIDISMCVRERERKRESQNPTATHAHVMNFDLYFVQCQNTCMSEAIG